jgi:hypoxanthine phosphoribosyltransferase
MDLKLVNLIMPELVSVFTQEEIQQNIAKVAEQISDDYRERDLILVGVLKGAFVFLSDLARCITIPAKIDFVRVSSYKNDMYSSGHIQLLYEPDTDVQGKDVLIVEDIVDTGLTLNYLIEYFDSKGPDSVKICALIDKRERREVDLTVDYVCLSVKSGFLVGFGLDYAENYRNLKNICHLKL